MEVKSKRGIKDVRWVILLSVVVSLVLLVGCASDSASSPDESEQEGNHSDASNNEAIDSIRVGWTGDINSLDPTDAPNVVAIGTLFNVYETLVDYDYEKAEVVPALAESWNVSEEGDVYTFHLNKGATFASGNPVTANDVKYSLDRLMAFTEASQRYILQPYLEEGEVKVIDDHTVEITIGNPSPTFLAALTAVPASILDSKVVEEHTEGDDFGKAWLNNNAAGSGPFLVEEFQRSGHITLAQNSNYWGEVPYLKQINIEFIDEASQQAILLERGDLDIAFNLLPSQIKDLESKGFNVSTDINPATYYVALNMAQEPYSNEKVRQAIKYAIDYDGIIDGIIDGFGTRAGGMIAEGFLGYDSSLNTQYSTDIEKAKQLLAEAGYPDGFKMELYMLDVAIEGIGAPNENLAAKIQSDLEQVGIDVEIIAQDVNTLFPAYRDGKIPSIIWFFTPAFPDPDTIMSTHGDWNTQATTRVGFNNQEVTDLILEAREELDADRREELYKQAQQIVNDDGPYVFLFRPNFTIVSNPDLKNVDWIPICQIDFSKIQ